MTIKIQGTNSTAAPGITGGDTDTGVQIGTNEVSLVTGGSEHVKVDSNGKVLIDTSSPSGYADRQLTVGDTSNASSNIEIRCATNGWGGISFSDSTAADANSYRGTVEYNHTDNYMQIRTNGGERIKITNEGLQINTSVSHGIESRTTLASTGSKYLYRGSNSSGSNIVFNVWANGTTENLTGTIGQISDRKLKENIVDSGSQWDDVKAFQFRKFNFTEESGYDRHTQLGVIAQEIETVSPGLIYEAPDTDIDGNDLGTVTKRVKTSILYMKAMKALQEAMERIETLETKVAALEAK